VQVEVDFAAPWQINGRRLVGTTLLKGDERRHVLLRGGETSYLTNETWGRHVLVVCVEWQNGTDRQIDKKKGLADPPPPLCYGIVV
jgi:hypothetical protein